MASSLLSSSIEELVYIKIELLLNSPFERVSQSDPTKPMVCITFAHAGGVTQCLPEVSPLLAHHQQPHRETLGLSCRLADSVCGLRRPH